MNKVFHGDCLEVMDEIPSGIIDLILCDLPYGTTACAWDSIIPFADLWKQYERLIKPNGAIVLTASQPFTSALVMSNPKLFKYEWIYVKPKGSNFATVKWQPMKEHESILVFGRKPQYFPIMQERSATGRSRVKTPIKETVSNGVYGKIDSGKGKFRTLSELRYPSSLQTFNRETGLHPTQKPTPLFEYLIKTYSNEGDLVLDNCAGSGTTAIACMNTNRKYICIEKEKEYYDIILKRIDDRLML